jgi:NTE family protein
VASFGVALGGGGPVGVAWELGVLAGLAESGIEANEARTIVGTSAGALVGAQVRRGRAAAELAAAQREIPPPPWTPDPALLGRLMELMATEPSPAVVREIAGLALSAPRAMEVAEEGFVSGIRALLGGGEWPEADLRVTAVDCDSGQTRVWTAGDGVDLGRAVTTSIAVPTLLGPVAVDGRRYMDGGVTSTSHLDLLAEAPVERAVFIGPIAGASAFAVQNGVLERERKLLVSRRIPVSLITPGPAFLTIAGNLLNPANQGPAYEVGIADGREAASGLMEFLDG